MYLFKIQTSPATKLDSSLHWTNRHSGRWFRALSEVLQPFFCRGSAAFKFLSAGADSLNYGLTPRNDRRYVLLDWVRARKTLPVGVWFPRTRMMTRVATYTVHCTHTHTSILIELKREKCPCPWKTSGWCPWNGGRTNGWCREPHLDSLLWQHNGSVQCGAVLYPYHRSVLSFEEPHLIPLTKGLTVCWIWDILNWILWIEFKMLNCCAIYPLDVIPLVNTSCIQISCLKVA